MAQEEIPALDVLVEALSRLREGRGAITAGEIDPESTLLSLPRYHQVPSESRGHEFISDLRVVIEELDEPSFTIAKGLLLDRDPTLGLTKRSDAIAADLAARSITKSADGSRVRNLQRYVFAQIVFALATSDIAALAVPRSVSLGYRWENVVLDMRVTASEPMRRVLDCSWTIRAVRPHVRLFAIAVNPENSRRRPTVTALSADRGHVLLTPRGLPLDASRPSGVLYYVVYLGRGLAAGEPETVSLRLDSSVKKARGESWVSGTAEGGIDKLTLRARVPASMAREYAPKEWRSTELTEEPLPHQWQARISDAPLEWEIKPVLGHYYRLEWRK